ncbi:MAG TPA: hypothetical protein VM600_04655 [Actinomycetota bacterium]|nr:hypothetical protein [Actinomycetota bacterium]
MRVRRALVGCMLVLVPSMVFAAPRDGGCSWPLKFDVDTLNAAFPDRNATYWLTRFVAAPGTELEITGTYPRARYMSFHVYDELQHPVDSLADIELEPDAGSLNRFSTPGAAEGGTYTARVVFTPRPSQRARNTIYAGTTDLDTANPSGFLIYRVYVPDDASSPEGSVPLPSVTVRAAGSGAGLGSIELCEPGPPSTGGAANHAIKESSFPNAIPRQVPWPPAQNPPRFVRFYSTEGAFLDRFPPNAVNDAVPRSKGGYLSNQHIAYLYALISRQYGDVFVFRAQAPRAPDTRSAAEVTDEADVRYWSVCHNEFVTQRFVECAADFEVALDPDGYFTFVISDPDDRPSNATADHGVTWLPWGGAYYDGTVIYRHMLPGAAFPEAIQNVPEGVSPAAVMGEYFPRAAYCDKARFEAGGAGACFGP